jgi:hypothetical protein
MMEGFTQMLSLIYKEKNVEADGLTKAVVDSQAGELKMTETVGQVTSNLPPIA